MSKKRILQVDDEQNILNYCRVDFEHEGYDFTSAESGEEAITILKKDYFDLLITDLAMPGVDGIGVLQEAKRHHPDICAIILTGYGDMTSAIEALRQGADDYLLKPCDTEELLLRVTGCLKKQEAFRKVKFYENILPVCIHCKSIRDDTGKNPGKGKWLKMEEYIHTKSGTDISHGCCPKCYEKHKDD